MHYAGPKYKVSVICLCYNQASFVKEAIQSVERQTYNFIELIIVDDASTDGSQGVIKKYLEANDLQISYKTLFLDKNIGNCAAFNKGWQLASGDYLIDLAADDMLAKERVEYGLIDLVERTKGRSKVNFCNAFYINEDNCKTGTHFNVRRNGKRFRKVKEGNVYQKVLAQHYILSPTLMISDEVMKYLGGYDENLYYEDFDFLIRSSNKFSYCYTNHCLVYKRVLSTGLSGKQYQKSDKKRIHPFLHSTYKVCEKAFYLNRLNSDHKALAKRLLYEIRKTLLIKEYLIAYKMAALGLKTGYYKVFFRGVMFLVNSGSKLKSCKT